MTELYPKVRYLIADGLLLFREGLSINFYFLQSHSEIAPMIIRSLDVYMREIGPDAIGKYVDENGYDQRLDAQHWRSIREDCLSGQSALIRLGDVLDCQYRYGFEYHGRQSSDAVGERRPPSGSAVSFWLPIEYIEEHGPGRVCELAVELANLVPFCSGHAGLAFNGEANPLSRSEETRALCFRYPGLDCADVGRLSWRLGARLRGAYWLTFLGQPLLSKVGGAETLRSRLTSPGTRVQEMEGDRVVISLGPSPEAGDLEQGQTLPAYRELARVLEPWLFHDEISARWEPGILRWERRFLD